MGWGTVGYGWWAAEHAREEEVGVGLLAAVEVLEGDEVWVKGCGPLRMFGRVKEGLH